MLLLITFLFLLASVLSAIAAYGVRPRPAAAGQSWPWWAIAAAVGAGVLMLIVIPAAALLSAP